MESKYNMIVDENFFVAKRNIIDYIWKSTKLEGLSVTFPDAQDIYNEVNVGSLKVDEVVAVNNLKHAWQFILENTDYTMDFPFICKVNQYVGASLFYHDGFIRTVPVNIGGTSWKPDLPIESIIKEEVNEILQIKSNTQKAITLMLYCMRKQIFIDGNKSTAILLANKILISSGEGIISIPIELQRNFTEFLIEFYETKEENKIMNFVYEQCIDGINFS